MTKPTTSAPDTSHDTVAPGDPAPWRRTAPVPEVRRRSRLQPAYPAAPPDRGAVFDEDPRGTSADTPAEPSRPEHRGWIVLRAVNRGGTTGLILASVVGLALSSRAGPFLLLALVPACVVLGMAGGLLSGTLLAATRRGSAVPRARLVAGVGAVLSVVIIAPIAHTYVIPNLGYAWWLVLCAVEAVIAAAAGPFLATGQRSARAYLAGTAKPSPVVTLVLAGTVVLAVWALDYTVEHMFDGWTYA
jgi:hypothetical protein